MGGSIFINDLFTRDSEPQEASAGPPPWKEMGPQIQVPAPATGEMPGKSLPSVSPGVAGESIRWWRRWKSGIIWIREPALNYLKAGLPLMSSR